MTLKLEDFRPAQVASVEEIVQYEAGIIVLGMGGGKTASFLTATKQLIEKGTIDRAIVIAPPRTLWSAWGSEPAKWDHLADLDVAVLSGPPAKRKKALDARDADVYVLSIDVSEWLTKYLRENWTDEELSRTLLGIDEISKFKSTSSKRAGKWLTIAPKFNGRWGLTGTPRHNGYMDLFNPIKIIGGWDAWGEDVSDFFDWRSLYFRAKDYQGFDWEPHPFALDKLERIAQEWLCYAPVDDLDLPELRTGDDYVRHVQLSDEQRRLAEEMRETLVAELMVKHPGASEDEIELLTVQAMSQGVASGKLVQITQGFLYDEEGNSHALEENPKLDMLLEMDSELGGDPAIIIYGLRAEIPQLEKVLKKDNRIARLGGGISAARAQATIEAWKRGEVDRLLLHPASAGHGVDGLQFGGYHMIHYHPTWSAEMYDQVIKRLHRPGQKREVFNWWVMADQSIDELKYARVESKLQDAEEFRNILRRIV